MRILLLGGAGMLGRDLAATVPEGCVLEAPSSSALDVTRREDLRAALDALRPDWVINAAAMTQVDRAEEEIERATRVNAEAPGVLGEECASRGTRVLHYSTDYVFDGRSERAYAEDDPTAPLNVYGGTKREGERALLATEAEALVVRTSWLYGRYGRSFPRTMWNRARAGEPTRVVDDQWGRPTSTADLARASWALVEQGATGILHVTNGGPATTWYGIARRVFEAAGAPHLVSPCGTADFPTPAARPRRSVLDITRVEQLVGALPSWEDALQSFLGELQREG